MSVTFVFLTFWSLHSPDPLQASPNPRRGSEHPFLLLLPPPHAPQLFQDRLLPTCTNPSPCGFGDALQHLLIEQGLLLTWERSFSLLPFCPTSHGSCYRAQTKFFSWTGPLVQIKNFLLEGSKILSWFHRTTKCICTSMIHRVTTPPAPLSGA